VLFDGNYTQSRAALGLRGFVAVISGSDAPGISGCT
jgi:hypothetical protein